MFCKVVSGSCAPYRIENLALDYPNVSFPATLSEATLEGYQIYLVRAVPEPDHDPLTQTLEEAAPALVDGSWLQQWTVRDLTPTELFDRIPKSVSALQGMRAIQAAGLVQAFLAWKATLDPVDDFETLAFLDKAQNWVWDDPIIDDALARLGVTAQKAALFTLANTL